MLDKPRILIIDDEPRMCQSLKELLAIQNYELNTANSAKEAIEFLNNNSFDLILLDLCLPDMNGYNVMDHICQQSIGALVIVLTGYASEESAIEALRRGAYDYLKKPFEPEKLLITVKNALNQKKIKRDEELAKQALRESEERYRCYINVANDGIAVLHNGKLSFVNSRLAEMIGYTTDEIEGHDFSRFIPKDILPQIEDLYKKCIAGEDLPSVYESKILHRDGRFIDVEYNISQVRIGDEQSTLNIIRDISARKKMQAEVLKAKKLASLGTLAGGIAHDFNNLLSVIVGNIDLAKEKIKNDFGIIKNLQEVEKACMRAKDLAARLITFSKGGKPIKKVTAIGELAMNAVSAFLRGSGINCEFCIPDDLFPVEIDALQIKQVIRNIVINATEAMNGKGTIRVSLKNAAVGENERLPLRAGNYVLLSIKDQGIGIASKNLAKIFDPYFSTKDMGAVKGQGLGLATCHSIIKNHDGFITAESESGVGATFIIYFPASEKQIEELEPIQGIKPEKPMVGTGRILAMDDEKMIRNLIEQTLTKFGYDVALAQDGAEAVELYRGAMESGKPFDAVILDLTVKSGMGAKSAAQKLLQINPHVKPIVSSAYFNDPVMIDFKKYGFAAALPKPYTKKDMKDTLSKVLTGKSADRSLMGLPPFPVEAN
jgi:two-component system cell cycle sensor histidine kinase/response regulator CckA